MDRRTKIVATIGPASRDREVLVRMVEAGMDVARLNFSHGNHELHAETAQIAKIEKPQGVERAEEILKVSDCVMVARGDLGVEMPIEEVPMIQKRLLALAGRMARPSITATQMLDSMVTSSRPTRAEVAD